MIFGAVATILQLEEKTSRIMVCMAFTSLSCQNNNSPYSVLNFFLCENVTPPIYVIL